MQAGLTLAGGEIRLSDGDRRFRLVLDALTLEAGQAIALTGASGSGKTLVLEILGLLRAPDLAMSYDWTSPDGQSWNLAGLWRDGPRGTALALRRGELFGFVPQTGGLLPFLNVADNIALPQQLTGRVDAVWRDALIDRLGLADVVGQFPATLSIGQRQRTAIARALAHRPPVVIADEPTAALDPDSADTVLQLLLDMAGQQGSGVILSSHDLDRVARFGVAAMRLAVGTGRDGTVTSKLEGAPC